MYSYAQYIDRVHHANAGLAALVFILFTVTALVYASKPTRDWFNQFRLYPLIPSWGLPLIMVFALMIRLPAMWNDPWFDETFSAAVARANWHALPAIILSDVHPPLPYLLQWGLICILGDSIFVLRLPSLFFGLINVYQIFRIGRVCGLTLPAARLAALALAVMPVHIVYSTEARQYTMLTALVLWSLLSILEDKPRRFALAALLGFVHAQGFIYLLVLGGLALYKWRWRGVSYVLFAGVISGLWVPFALLQSSDVSNGWWNPPLNAQGSIAYILDTTIGRGITPGTGILVYSVIVPLTAVGLWEWTRNRKNRSVLYIYASVPLLTAVASLLWGHNIFMARSLLPAASLITLMWGYALSKLPPRHALRNVVSPTLLMATVITVWGPTIPWGQYFNCGDRPVYAASNHLAIMAQFYNPHKTIFVRSQGNDWTQYLTDDARAAMGFIPVDTPPPGACIIYQLSPLIGDEQRAYIASVTQGVTGHRYIQKDIYELWVYEL